MLKAALLILGAARVAAPALAHPKLVSTICCLFGMINWTHTWFDPAGPVSAAEGASMAVR